MYKIINSFIFKQKISLFTSYNNLFSKDYRKETLNLILKKKEYLKMFPFIGKKISFTLNGNMLRKYIIHKNYSVIYYVDETLKIIFIQDLIHNRMNNPY